MNPDNLPATRSALRSLRRALRQPRWRSLLALLILALGAGWYITTRGGWVNALCLPPTLDASTPRSQNGWVLEAIQLPAYTQSENQQKVSGFSLGRASYSNVILDGADRANAFGIWLTPPREDAAASSQNPGLFSASARLSTGETLRLGRLVRHWKGGQALIFVGLPTGYSPACRFAEITLSDGHGHTACWRFSRLPRMHDVIPPPVTAVASITQNGVTVSAQAWNVYTGVCGYRFSPSFPPQSHQWELILNRREYAWEPFGYTGKGSQPFKEKISSNKEASAASIVYEGYTDFNYYPRTNRFLRMTTEMHEFETYDEPVTFHNVTVKRDRLSNAYYIVLPKQLSQTTPSGVTITLPAQGERTDSLTSSAFNVIMSVQPRITSEENTYSLPKSPLTYTYGKPVRLRITLARPYTQTGGFYEPKQDVPAYYATSFSGTPPPSVFKDFTIIVHQRVDLQTIPMTFTLPIADRGPEINYQVIFNQGVFDDQ